MAGILAGGDGTERAELLVVFEVHAVDGLAEGAVGLDSVGRDGAPKVVGDEREVVHVIDGDVGGACPVGGNLASLLESSGFGVNGKACYRGGGIVDGVDGVEKAFTGACGCYCQIGGAGSSHSQDGRGQHTLCRVEVCLVDAFADTFQGVSADVDCEGRGRGSRFFLAEMP